jgi:hypothetical protein
MTLASTNTAQLVGCASRSSQSCPQAPSAMPGRSGSTPSQAATAVAPSYAAGQTCAARDTTQKLLIVIGAVVVAVLVVVAVVLAARRGMP